MDDNIILVGMPASGKSVVGELLAQKRTEYTLIDTDSVIEKTMGMKICDIFLKYSEDYFRKIEYDTIKMVCKGKNKIISTGGGAFENPDNRNTLLNFGKVFYLKSALDVLYYRIKDDTSRPLLKSENPQEILSELLKKREYNYQKAHFIIDTADLNEEETATKILGYLDETSASG